MLILIEGIFFQRYKGNKFPAKKLKKAQDIEVIMNHPWGRDAYKLLLSSIKKNVPSNLVKNKYDLHGYPLALHLWILESVPLLQSSFSTISVIESPQAFLCEKYTSTASPSIAQVENIEALKHLKVISILPSIPGDEEDSVALEDINDQDLSFLMEVINKGYKLTVDDWTKGCLDVGAVMEEIAIMSYQLRNKETLKPSSSGESIMDKLDNLYKIVQEGFRTTNTRLSKIEEHLNIPKAANTDDQHERQNDGEIPPDNTTHDEYDPMHVPDPVMTENDNQCDTENDKQYETENEYDPMPATSPLMTENDLQCDTENVQEKITEKDTREANTQNEDEDQSNNQNENREFDPEDSYCFPSPTQSLSQTVQLLEEVEVMYEKKWRKGIVRTIFQESVQVYMYDSEKEHIFDKKNIRFYNKEKILHQDSTSKPPTPANQNPNEETQPENSTAEFYTPTEANTQTQTEVITEKLDQSNEMNTNEANEKTEEITQKMDQVDEVITRIVEETVEITQKMDQVDEVITQIVEETDELTKKMDPADKDGEEEQEGNQNEEDS
ncbi:myb-like protein X [Capsella rubella]|uniref:myb-like protein X n=1 Tax=Capsella rubella TaxID=81985 RepID=UPI000CD4CB4F|nr:myb-like protein X [Capsella rubella]